MRAKGIWIAAIVAGASWAGATAAAPCYVVYDRADVVIFRDYAPPFDLSDPKSPERAMMRQNGQHLLVAEFENCNAVGFISATTGGTTATVDEIVNGLQPAIGTSMGSAGGTSGNASARGAPPSGTAGPAGTAANSGNAPVPRTVSGASSMMRRTY